MRAISLWQPWASLIAEGVKTIETRPKRSPWSAAIGETIAIHAAKRAVPTMTLGEWHSDPRYRTEPRVPAEPRIWRSLTQPGDLFGSHESRPLPLGAVVATCRLLDVVPMTVDWSATDCLTIIEYTTDRPDTLALRRNDEIEWVTEQRPFGDYAPGRWALLLDEIVKVDPVPVRGRQGLWRLPSGIGLQPSGHSDRFIGSAGSARR